MEGTVRLYWSSSLCFSSFLDLFLTIFINVWNKINKPRMFLSLSFHLMILMKRRRDHRIVAVEKEEDPHAILHFHVSLTFVVIVLDCHFLFTYRS